MDIESLRDYCLGLRGATEGMKWEHLCFMIEEKIFVLASLEDGHLCMKCDPEDFDELTARHGIQQAPHFARRQWVELESLEVMPDNELQKRIADSRKLVLSKLSKKIQSKYA
ncbi:MAG: MmcQ/YjbR family DNA-binding protein [Candidatus Pedobacter colombiensis]|uniref:MmcQ/YjbR family DNA-binding protein n=1 Tax=Candidatus Pedobacter colombiensis TaxID=3121371 RepID=A0AAJ5WB20_9SPHI|nr:MmcQ/YjbR family DNA-binding protein [Pedobacter sp.]WEK20366.1 MAG: MmcQ/YjbR family DNA-binding protein [Pedobacter sp.]